MRTCMVPCVGWGLGGAGEPACLPGTSAARVVRVPVLHSTPLLQLADYGLVADLFQALPELEREIAKAKGKA